MNKSQAIKSYCLDCSGGIKKDVTLCHLIDCPLWPFRFGYSIKDKRYEERIMSAKRKYPKEYKEVIELIREYSKSMPNSSENVQIDAFLARKVA
ncbi:hypothetical protein ACFLRM_06900 [Acidobacteriota bacterium]